MTNRYITSTCITGTIQGLQSSGNWLYTDMRDFNMSLFQKYSVLARCQSGAVTSGGVACSSVSVCVMSPSSE